MTQWYYADAQRQRQGPVDTETLAARLSQGIIDRTSLVWREGLPQWVTLTEVASELGVDAAGPAIPEPPASSPVAAPADAAQWAAAPAAPSPQAATPATDTPIGTTVLSAAAEPADPALRDHHTTVDHHPDPSDAPVAPTESTSWSGSPTGVVDASAQPTPTTPAPAPTETVPPAAATPLPSAWETPVAASPAAAIVHDAPVVYAGLWRRVAASILDSLITTFAVYLIVIPLVFVIVLATTHGDSGSALDDGSALGIAIVVMSYGIGLAIPTLYFAWMQSSRLQASLGKLACGIKVVRADSNGARVGFWRNVLRYLAYMLISVLTLGIGAVVAAFMAGMSQRKQTPHDKICDTLVVDRWAFTDRPELQSRGLDTVSIVVLAIYGVILVLSIVVVAIMLATIGMSQS
ncbi:RDD family protein [Xanthomonas pisi]|uniref:RDD family protein n=1 Tax=Xanthomonas pisi TaxID=56457 RepID=A0A2S7D2I6_9XANT|nr:RDD family protein [Xanthomonas pisi]KLD70627.1 RDD family protein [Xanthomonas pisi DSM 18956]PPU68020.1 RDD family protein [Xanthomonas pisi]